MLTSPWPDGCRWHRVSAEQRHAGLSAAGEVQQIDVCQGNRIRRQSFWKRHSCSGLHSLIDSSPCLCVASASSVGSDCVRQPVPSVTGRLKEWFRPRRKLGLLANVVKSERLSATNVRRSVGAVVKSHSHLQADDHKAGTDQLSQSYGFPATIKAHGMG